jgi:hypothetical protein
MAQTRRDDGTDDLRAALCYVPIAGAVLAILLLTYAETRRLRVQGAQSLVLHVAALLALCLLGLIGAALGLVWPGAALVWIRTTYLLLLIGVLGAFAVLGTAAWRGGETILPWVEDLAERVRGEG